MQKGYDIFGKAYGVMLRSDLHAPGSIDHRLMQEMILVEQESEAVLYGAVPELASMENHPLYAFAQRFRGGDERRTVQNVLAYTSAMAARCDTPFEEMLFGGTEQEILSRGTDWCADLARVCAVLLDCLGVPARLVNLANIHKAYHGHVAVEAFYEGRYQFCDPVYGYHFAQDVRGLVRNAALLQAVPQDYAGLFAAAAISAYNPLDPSNCYEISRPNPYYLTLIGADHQGRWIQGEDA